MSLANRSGEWAREVLLDVVQGVGKSAPFVVLQHPFPLQAQRSARGRRLHFPAFISRLRGKPPFQKIFSTEPKTFRGSGLFSSAAGCRPFPPPSPSCFFAWYCYPTGEAGVCVRRSYFLEDPPASTGHQVHLDKL